MFIGLAFWILMLIWLLFGAFPYWKSTQPVNWGVASGGLLLFILLVLLGWHAFGPPIHS